MKAFLSEEEQCRVERLRSLVKEHLSEYYDTDFNLLRWIQGHSLSIDNIAEKLIIHLKARSSIWNLDGMHENPRQHPIQTHHRMYITGLSGIIDNLLVAVEQCGQLDYWGMLQTYSLTEISLALVVDVEHLLARVMQLERETGRQASVLYIMDLTGMKYDPRLYQLVVGPLKCLAIFISEHYAELIKYFVLAGAPPFVYPLYKMAKPLLPTRIRDRVYIMSSPNWRSNILSLAKAESLPNKWNVGNENIFKFPVELPTRFRENERHNIFAMPTSMEVLHVDALREKYVTEKLDVGDVLYWWFTADSDFAFGIYFSQHAEDSDKRRMQTIYPSFGPLPGPVFTPIQGSIIANRSGYYKILFTSHCRWRPLNITFKIRDRSP